MAMVLTGVPLCLNLPPPAEAAVQARPETLCVAVAEMPSFGAFTNGCCVSSAGVLRSPDRIGRFALSAINLSVCWSCPWPLLGVRLHRWTLVLLVLVWPRCCVATLAGTFCELTQLPSAWPCLPACPLLTPWAWQCRLPGDCLADLIFVGCSRVSAWLLFQGQLHVPEGLSTNAPGTGSAGLAARLLPL